MSFSGQSTARVRLLATAALSAALLMGTVSSTFAASVPQPAGTLVGSVSCGLSTQTPAAQALVEIPGIDLDTRAAGDGKFTLTNVPTGEALIVMALSDALGSDVTARPVSSLQDGETLDIGNLSLTACPTPVPAPADQPLGQTKLGETQQGYSQQGESQAQP